MIPAFADDFVSIYHGDCLDVMASLEAESVDAIVTDPPYGLSFMGRDWDHGVPGEHFWREALRVAKPGAHLVAFGGTRTFHRLTCAIEDAGWEVRDCLGWLYGQGFPKSLDVSKAIDKEAGNERPDREVSEYAGNDVLSPTITVQSAGTPVSAAAAWNGWGTALKPAWEPIVLARKPLGSTVAACVQTWGTGAMNIDGCRVGWASDEDAAAAVGFSKSMAAGRTQAPTSFPTNYVKPPYEPSKMTGRWPENIVHDGSEEVLAVFPQTSAGGYPARRAGIGYHEHASGQDGLDARATDSGSAARFFYTAKAAKAERDDGLYGFEEKRGSTEQYDSRWKEGTGEDRQPMRRNTHPTVKPLDLMRWLVRLVTPPDGIVLDPFMGSGTTLKAARAEGHTSIGIDLERDHCEIAWGRMSQGVLL